MICPSGPASSWYVPVVQHLHDMFQWSGIFMICPSGLASLWYFPVVWHLHDKSQWTGIFKICPSGPASLWYVPVVRHLCMSQWFGIFVCPSNPTSYDISQWSGIFICVCLSGPASSWYLPVVRRKHRQGFLTHESPPLSISSVTLVVIVLPAVQLPLKSGKNNGYST